MGTHHRSLLEAASQAAALLSSQPPSPARKFAATINPRLLWPSRRRSHLSDHDAVVNPPLPSLLLTNHAGAAKQNKRRRSRLEKEENQKKKRREES
jgi:hypothetical protein